MKSDRWSYKVMTAVWCSPKRIASSTILHSYNKGKDNPKIFKPDLTNFVSDIKTFWTAEPTHQPIKRLRAFDLKKLSYGLCNHAPRPPRSPLIHLPSYFLQTEISLHNVGSREVTTALTPPSATEILFKIELLHHLLIILLSSRQLFSFIFVNMPHQR